MPYHEARSYLCPTHSSPTENGEEIVSCILVKNHGKNSFSMNLASKSNVPQPLQCLACNHQGM